MSSTRGSLLPNGGILARRLVVDDEAVLAADRLHLRILDRGEAVRGDRQAGDAEGHRAHDVAVVQRHHEPLVVVVVVRVVDAIHRVDVGLREPLHHVVELRHHVVVVEDVARHRAEGRRDLHAALFVAPAVDRVEQGLREIHARAEVLHLLADAHRRDAARDAVVVAELRHHQVVVFILERRGLDARGDAVALECLRQILRPEDREVGLGRGAEILERVQDAEARARDERAPVERHAADDFGGPVGIAGKERVVGRRAQEADDAQLDHELVDEFLRFVFGQRFLREIALDVDVEEGRDAPDRHRGAVHFLDRAEVAEIGPLHGLARVRRGPADVEAIRRRHRLEVGERAHLVGHVHAQLHHLLPSASVPSICARSAFFAAIRRSTPYSATRR